MAFGLYSLILVGVLLMNAVAILNERFLKQLGLERPDPMAPQDTRTRILTLLYGDARLLLQMPLIWTNMVCIVLLLILG